MTSRVALPSTRSLIRPANRLGGRGADFQAEAAQQAAQAHLHIQQLI